MILGCNGCVTYTKFPDITTTKAASVQQAPVVKVTQQECKKLDLPDQPPKVIHIAREPGKKTIVDEGGRKLLEDYMDIRYQINNLWYKKP